MPPSTRKIDPDNKYSAHFRAVRQRLGLTQQQLADRLLLSQNYVAQIEMGRKTPSSRVLSGLAALTGHSDLVSGNVIAQDEEQAPNGTARALEAQARRLFEDVLRSAKNDPGRIGWIVEQMKEHVAPPKNWQPPAGREFVHVKLPSQTQALSTETGLPIPNPSRPARSA